MERIAERIARKPRRRSLFAWLGRLAEIRRQRQALARLSADQLEDTGISERERRIEISRKAWDVPPHWLR